MPDPTTTLALLLIGAAGGFALGLSLKCMLSFGAGYRAAQLAVADELTEILHTPDELRHGGAL